MRLMVSASLLALAVLPLSPSGVAANDSGVGGAGMNVKPVTSTSIRMTAETVQVIALQQYAEYQVDFQFENRGSAQRVKLGFPFPVPTEQDYIPPAGFRAWQGRKLLPVTYQEVDTEAGRLGYYLHEAVFPHGTTMIRVRYFASPDSGVGGDLPDGINPPARFTPSASFWGAYPYTVSTGAGWVGTIGTSVIRYYVSRDALLWGVDLAAEQQAELTTDDQGNPDSAWTSVFLSYTRPAPGIYQWKFTDYEPRPDKYGGSPYDIALPFELPVGGEEATTAAWEPYATITKSSELHVGNVTYPAYQAVDGIPSTAWAEGVPGSGTGQFFKVTFPEDRHVGEIRVLPGYAKTAALFYKYNRPKTLAVEFSDGTKKTLDLADEPDLQRFSVDTSATWAKVTIGEVYRGTTRDETYLSEIEFGTAQAPAMMSFRDVIDGKLPPQELTIATTGAPAPRREKTLTVTAQPAVTKRPSGRAGTWIPLAVAAGCAIALGFVAWIAARRRRAMPATADESRPPDML